MGRVLRAFFGVAVRGQSYRNLVYLALSFPLGVAYFTFLVTGLSAGTALIIFWVGIPILLLTLAGWWVMGMLERQLVIRRCGSISHRCREGTHREVHGRG